MIEMSGIDEKPKSLKKRKENEFFSLEREFERRLIDKIQENMQSFLRLYESPDPTLAGLMYGEAIPVPNALVRAVAWLRYRRRMLRRVRNR